MQGKNIITKGSDFKHMKTIFATSNTLEGIQICTSKQQLTEAA